MFTKERMKAALETMLFVWGRPLAAKDAANALNISEQECTDLLLELAGEYDEAGRGIRIRRMGRSFQMATDPANGSFVRRLCTPVKVKRLSQAALEVLAIIAYRQPVTKGEIEAIRGIRCDRVVEGLRQKDLIRECGRSTGVGRPILYGTTDTFLQQFGFATLEELPEINDIGDVIGIEEDEEGTDPRQIHMKMEE